MGPVLLLAPVLLSCQPGEAQSDARLLLCSDLHFLDRGDTAAASRRDGQDMTLREKVAPVDDGALVLQTGRTRFQNRGA